MDGIVRVLHVTEALDAAGIESFIMNTYRRIDRNKVQFDFLVMRDQEEYYEKEINSLGGKKYSIQSAKNNTLLKVLDEARMMEVFLQKHDYEIVHIHATTALRAPYLRAANRAGVKKRIYHAHSAYVSGKSKFKLMIYDYMKSVMANNGTHFFACSMAAAEWVYSDEMIKNDRCRVIYNGIETSKFVYNSSQRENIRKELGIDDKFVIIHTGRFTDQKNQLFLIDVFEKCLLKKSNAKLLLLGEGELFDTVEQKVKDMGLQNQVTFLGVRNNVYDYLSAADVFVMPSLYEGLPVAAVEAQCAGLPCVLSENITKEVALTDEVCFMNLADDLNNWAERICNMATDKREAYSAIIKDKGYDIDTVSNKLQEFYLGVSEI